jgi:hypothetical protein
MNEESMEEDGERPVVDAFQSPDERLTALPNYPRIRMPRHTAIAAPLSCRSRVDQCLLEILEFFIF